MTYKEYKSLHESKIIDKFDIKHKNFYVYRITNKLIGMHYYGSRVSSTEPIKDIGIKYFSSSYDKEFILDQKLNPLNYRYKVVKICQNNLDKQLFESYLHQKFNVKDNSKFYNKANQTPVGFDCTGHTYNLGRSPSEETKSKIRNSLKGRIISEETKEKMRINAISRTKDENLKRGIKHKGKVVSNETKMIQKINNTGSTNPFAKITLIYDANGNLIELCDGTFKFICETNGYPHNTLKYAKNGKKLYVNENGIVSKNVPHINRKFVGWYIEVKEKLC